jgi:isoleucyl-tRNA synthetase
VTNGIVLAEDGQKMSKSKKNYPDPKLIFDKYGADAMRFYLLSSPVVRADDLRFSEKGVEEIIKSVFLPLKNSFSFFANLANIDGWKPESPHPNPLPGGEGANKLDKWILAELGNHLKNMTEKLDNYELDGAAREIPEFMDKLTNFYIRRSRRRFWKEENDSDKLEAFSTLYTVLLTVCKMLAPFAPFYPEAVYKSLVQDESDSVHFCDWPDFNDFADDESLREEIMVIRAIISLGHTIRARKKIRVRQPLAKVQIALPPKYNMQIIKDNEAVIAEELNIKAIDILADPKEIAEKIAMPDARKLGPKYGKEVQTIIKEAKAGNFKELENGQIEVAGFTLEAGEFEFAFNSKSGLDVDSAGGIVVALDTEITEELKNEGIAREIIRQIQDMRKEADYQIADRIQISIEGAEEIVAKFADWIKEEVLATEIAEDLSQEDLQKEVELEGEKVVLKIKK